MLENIVRPMFWKMIEWNIGSEYDFKVSVGKSGKFAKRYLTKSLYENILKTYADSGIESNWRALFLMIKVFREEQEKLAKKLNFYINIEEVKYSTKYMEEIEKE